VAEVEEGIVAEKGQRLRLAFPFFFAGDTPEVSVLFKRR
jgi:hypothetical protein